MRYEKLMELRHAQMLARAGGQEPLALTVDSDDAYACTEAGECVFRMHPCDLLSEALDLLGIEHREP